MFSVKNLLNNAKKLNKTIIFPEAEYSDRTLKAVELILKQRLCKVILLGDAEVILSKGNKLKGATIINPKASALTTELATKLYEKRKEKGLTEAQAKELILQPFYFAALMVECGYADGMLGGAETSTADSLRPGLQIIKAKPGIKTISACTMYIGTGKMGYGDNNMIILSDTALNINPTAEQLCDIAVSAAATAKSVCGMNPKVAFLSFSTKGSGGDGPEVKKVAEAVELMKDRKVDFVYDGEIQLDAAIIPEIAKQKDKNGVLEGKANIFVLPDLNCGNICYKMLERFTDLTAVGQICLGFNKPVNDLSRGCNVNDIVLMTAVTALQTQN